MNETSSADSDESFFSHLIELRDRLIRAFGSVIVVFLGLAWFARDLYRILAQPMIDALPKGGQMIATDIAGGFLVPMKVALMVAFLIALPYVLYQAWVFIAPGLYTREKKFVLPVVVSSVILFFVGMAFAYFAFFPMVFRFMAHFMPEGVAWMTDIEKYLSFVMTMFFAFGLVFEVPIIVLVLVRMGMVSVNKLKEVRPYVIVGAFVLGAVFTPPDVVSQFMLALPLCLLYESGVFFARFVEPRGDVSETAQPEQPTNE